MMKLCLAPLQGLTEYVFRTVWSNYFFGLDYAYSPFIPLTDGTKVKPSHLKDVLPANNNSSIPVIPQVLGNKSDQFLLMANELAALGYKEMNWNMGCPVKIVVKKRRGSGLLPYPEMIHEILDDIMPELPLKLSVKVRLGLKDVKEIWPVIETLNQFPLKKVIVHPRLGIDMYDREADVEAFDKVASASKHPVVYNGDIFTLSHFLKLKKQLPYVKEWMVGRGVLRNPFLPQKITGQVSPGTEVTQDMLFVFYNALFDSVKKQTLSENRALGKMKDYWFYFSNWFENSEKAYLSITRETEMAGFTKKTKEIFDGELSKQLLEE